MKKSFLLLALMLTACTPKKRVEFLYQDTKGAVYEAYCSGTSQSMGVCYRLANQTCGGKFEILIKE
ncbi:MAG: hypothetical protein IJ870_07110 [Alphaproteobacteria bacterium]|nr:hypothetical protein [Alphaproteobacteria bacterium]